MMKNRKLMISVLLLLSNTVFLFAYGNNITSCDAATINGLPDPRLCMGYSDDKQMPEPIACLAVGTTSFDSGGKGIIDLGQEYSFEEIQKYLHVDFSVKGGIGPFSGDANAEYVKHIKSTNYSESFNYLEQIIFPVERFTPVGSDISTLNDYGQRAYKSGPDIFRSYCGNKFYQQQTLGADLFVNFNIHFNSAYDREKFDAHIGAGIGDFFSASGSIQRIAQQNNIQGSLEISAMQEGGNPTYLAGIFGKCGDNYCVASCNLQNPKDCQGVIDGILSYVDPKNSDPTTFPKQIDYQGGRVTGNAVPIDFSFVDYQALGLNVGQPVVTPGNPIWNIRQNLWLLRETTQANLVFIDHVLNSYLEPYISQSYLIKLTALSNALHDNLDLLEDPDYGAIGCYYYPLNCATINNQINSQLEPIDQDTLRLFANSYKAQDVTQGVSTASFFYIPIGVNQYQVFSVGGTSSNASATVVLSPDENTITLKFNPPAIIWGTYTKQADGSYKGVTHVNGQPDRESIWTIIDNPV